MAKEKILILVGPTSSGKSALAAALAKKFNGEVISADSRQVYRGLNIGTGKVTKKEMGGIPHHLLDVASPKKVFTAQDFIKKGREAIVDIAARGKLPIITGGTGFYIDVLVGRITLPEVPVNKKLRAALEKNSTAQLFAMLKKKDSRRADTIDRRNKVRLVRALEIAHTLGKVPRLTKDGPMHNALWIGITPEKEELYKRIHTRLLSRMRQGMVAEAKRLHTQGLSYKRMRELGLEYRALASLLEDKISKPEMIEQLERDIVHYSKRQMTYWKRNKGIQWFNPAQTHHEIEKFVRSFVKSTKSSLR